MDKVYLYSPYSLTNVNFLFFDIDGLLVDTVSGTLQFDQVWYANLPSLEDGIYTVVGVSLQDGSLGKEDIIIEDGKIIETSDVVKEKFQIDLDKLTMLYELMGLNEQKPLTVTKTLRSFGTVQQTIDETEDQTVVTRIQ